MPYLCRLSKQQSPTSSMKRKKQEKGERKSVHRAAQRTEFIDEIQKVNNPLTKHTDPESEKIVSKIDA